MGRGALRFIVRLLICAILVAGFALAARAEEELDLRSQIEAKNQEIKRLEDEASRYRAALGDAERAANTLGAEIARIEATTKRIEADIRVTDAKINRTNLEIKGILREIGETETAIGEDRERLGLLLAALADRERETPLEIFVKHETVSAFFTALDELVGIQQGLAEIIAELRETKKVLGDRKTLGESKRRELAALADELGDQKALQLAERRERANLLAETKSQERRYRELLTEVERRRSALQDEINAAEAKLAPAFDRSLLPAPGAGILGWPLPSPIFITQYFGRTSFARAGGYNGNGHNGIDLRASVGTPVFASAEGRVRATGDTDVACRRASYGRWVLVDHPSNLSTLYAHLSLVKVAPGDGVNRGEIIGYSGRTGYATGPHLHLSVFARQAVHIGPLPSKTCGGRIMTLPLSPFGGYLNPLDYLPR